MHTRKPISKSVLYAGVRMFESRKFCLLFNIQNTKYRAAVHAMTKSGRSVPREFSISLVMLANANASLGIRVRLRLRVVVHIYFHVFSSLLNICHTKFILEKCHFGVAFLFGSFFYSVRPHPASLR